LLAALGSNTISSTGNITTTANISGGNILASNTVNSVSFTGTTVSVSGNVSGGNLVLPSAGRIIGDFSASTLSNRTVMQTSNTATGGFTVLGLLPGTGFTGTGFATGLTLGNVTDLGNSGYIGMQNRGAEGRITTDRNGTGGYPYMTFYTGGSERARIDTSGNVGIANTAPLDKLAVTGTAYISSNITGGNILTAGIVSATGNITGSYILGNGSQLTGIVTSSYGNSNVVTLLSAFGSNTISTTGNITGGNVIATSVQSNDIFNPFLLTGM
jgi:hypothetical protein